jgi:hypothetical protein
VSRKSVAGLVFQHQDLIVEPWPFSIFFWTKRGYTEALVASAMKSKIDNYFSLANCKYRNITAAEIIAVASSVDGVAYIDSIDTTTYSGSGFATPGDGNMTYLAKNYAIFAQAWCNSQGIVDFG